MQTYKPLRRKVMDGIKNGFSAENLTALEDLTKFCMDFNTFFWDKEIKAFDIQNGIYIKPIFEKVDDMYIKLKNIKLLFVGVPREKKTPDTFNVNWIFDGAFWNFSYAIPKFETNKNKEAENN